MIIKAIILILCSTIVVLGESYPSKFSQMGTPLYKANITFQKYKNLNTTQILIEKYHKSTTDTLLYGYKLDKINEPSQKSMILYLQMLRELQKKHDYIIHVLSSLLFKSIDKNNYHDFNYIANIELKSIFKFKHKKIIDYYKRNITQGKINNIEDLIVYHSLLDNSNDTKIKKIKPLYDIYWSSSIGGNRGYQSAIYGAHRDNLKKPTKIISLSTRINPCTVDKEGNIYWCDVSNGSIYKSNPDATSVEQIISNLEHPIGIAIDNEGGKLYWADWLSSEKKGVISSSNLSGSNKKVLLNRKLRSGGHLFYDALHHNLYISDLFGKKILIFNVNTKTTTQILSVDQASDIVLDYINNRIIWADISKDTISSANLDGSDIKVLISFISQFANPKALTIDTVNQRLVYSISHTKTSTTRIETANLDGSNRKLVNRSVEASPQSLYSVF